MSVTCMQQHCCVRDFSRYPQRLSFTSKISIPRFAQASPHPDARADSPAHPCDMSNPAPGFLWESTGRYGRYSGAMDYAMLFFSCWCRSIVFALLLVSRPTRNVSVAAPKPLQTFSHARSSPHTPLVSTQNTQTSALCLIGTRRRGAPRWRAQRHIWKLKENVIVPAVKIWPCAVNANNDDERLTVPS